MSPVAPDYEAEDVLVVDDPERFRALADELRARIVLMLRERAYSTSELADVLGIPKGTVGHHLKVLERAGLIRVVRTRQVRAVTEKYYGRVARLFLIQGEHDPNAYAAPLRQAADEVARAEEILEFAAIHLRLSEADATRFAARLKKLVDDYRARERRDGVRLGLAAVLYRRSAR